tara:strand:- start:34 stop:339 length:306 start_codon:yes stop_codon:yes gene_type:complete
MGSLNLSAYLAEADTLVSGERQQEYGPPDKNLDDIARGWRVLLGCPVTPRQVALCMTWLKLARLSSPSISETVAHDSIVDGIGYLSIAGALGPGAGRSNDV